MHLHGQQFSGVLEKFSCTSSGFFFWLKCEKKFFFEDKCFLVKCFIKLKCRRLQTGLAILKNIEHLNFFKGQNFYAIFKNHIFPRFLKIISSTRKNQCMRLILCQHGTQNLTKLD